MVGIALQAAEELAKQGIEAEVIDLRTLRPLDTETIVEVGQEDQPPGHGRGRLAVRRHRRELAAADDGARLRLARRAGRCASHGVDVPLPYAANLEKLALPQPENIVEAATRSLQSLTRGARTMSINILMPALSPTMTEGKLAKWHVKGRRHGQVRRRDRRDRDRQGDHGGRGGRRGQARPDRRRRHPWPPMAIPPRVGPSKAAPFQSREFNATALGSTERGTSEGNNAWRAGPSNEPTDELIKVNKKICQAWIWPA